MSKTTDKKLVFTNKGLLWISIEVFNIILEEGYFEQKDGTRIWFE